MTASFLHEFSGAVKNHTTFRMHSVASLYSEQHNAENDASGN